MTYKTVFVEFEGLQSSLKYLNKVAPKELRTHLTRNVKELVRKHTIPRVKKYAPKDTGTMARAANVVFNIRSGRIGIKLGSKRAWYTHFVHNGHKTRGLKSHVRPRKYGWAAVIHTYDEVSSGYEKLLDQYAKDATAHLNRFGGSKK